MLLIWLPEHVPQLRENRRWGIQFAFLHEPEETAGIAARFYLLSGPFHLIGVQAMVFQAQIADESGGVLAKLLFEQDKASQQGIVPAAAGDFLRLLHKINVLPQFHTLMGEIRPDFLRSLRRIGQQGTETSLKLLLCQNLADDNAPPSVRRGPPRRTALLSNMDQYPVLGRGVAGL